MNKKTYKEAFRNMNPDEQFEQKLAQKLAEKGSSHYFGRKRKVILPVFVGLGVAACAWMYIVNDHNVQPNPSASQPTASTSVEGAVFIPKLQLPKQTNATMDMIGLIVYQGRIYTQTSTRIAPEAAKSLVGDRIGRTKGTIDEWSKQEDFAKELASSIGEQDVYTVKGYDSEFRIMTYQIADGQIWSEFYEALNGITISSGADLFQKLKIMGHVQSASWEDFNSWNNDLKQRNELPEGAPLQDFLQELYRATPIEWDKLYSQGIYDKGDRTRKFVLLKLKDQTEIRLDLHEGGYVRYSTARVFFKLDEAVFAAMWGSLK